MEKEEKCVDVVGYRRARCVILCLPVCLLLNLSPEVTPPYLVGVDERVYSILVPSFPIWCLDFF